MASTRRDLIYRMTADPEGFKKGMREAGKDSRQFWKELKDLESQQAAVDEVSNMAGTALIGFGAAAGIGLGLAAKAAIEWESAWTGVTKVVNGSPEQLDALEQELRDLATTLPQTHAEIAGVAAAAGQLGIAREDIVGFTEVMVAMGVSTNLASKDAATALARMMNIMGTSTDDVDKLGSAIVGLGNTTATTEAEIVTMALRIAGAGETVGMTEAEVLGFAAALSSVGIEAEAGGSSISTAMIKIAEAVNEGGESLQGFADVAGVTADEFAQQFRDDPAAAIDSFVQGLGRIEESGGNVFGILNDLGLSEIRLRDALLRLANAGDLLNETLETGRDAWDENSALMEEAARRYGTTESQIKIARNQLVDLGISLGETLLPVIQKLLDIGTGLMSFFEDLPEPVKTGIVVLGGVAAVIGLVGGAALLAVPKIHALNVALLEMGTKRASVAQKALSGVSRVLTGPWGLAIGAAVTVLGIFAAQQAESRAQTDELAATLDDQTAAITHNTRVWAAHELETSGSLKAAQQLGLDLSTVTDAVLGNSAALEEVQSAYMGAYDAIEQFLAAHDLETLADADESLQDEVDALIENGEAADILKGQIEDLNGTYDDAVTATEREIEARGESTQAAKEASGAEEVLAEQLNITTDAASTATDAFADLDEKIRELIDSAFALSGAQRDVEAGIDELTETLMENGATLDANTEVGRENQVAIEDQIAAIADLAVTTAQQTGSTAEANAVLAEQRDRLREVLEQAGFTEAEIQDYIGVLDSVPAEIETAVETSGLDSAIAHAESLDRLLDAVDRTVNISFEHDGFLPTGGISVPREHGGVTYHAQDGLLREAGVFSPVFPARFAFAEPQTGGEAFIPMRGDRSRSLGILQEAASWYRASVVPGEAGAQTVNVNVHSYGDGFNLRDVMDDLSMRGLV